MPRGSYDFEREIDGQMLTITVDTSDYPEFIIEGAANDDGDEVVLTKQQEDALYMELGEAIAGRMCDDAMDYYEDR